MLQRIISGVYYGDSKVLYLFLNYLIEHILNTLQNTNIFKR